MTGYLVDTSVINRMSSQVVAARTEALDTALWRRAIVDLEVFWPSPLT